MSDLCDWCDTILERDNYGTYGKAETQVPESDAVLTSSSPGSTVVTPSPKDAAAPSVTPEKVPYSIKVLVWGSLL